MADQEISTGGGAAIRGNIGTGGGKFVGHDNISYENNEYLQFIRDQLMDVKVRVEFIEHAIEESKAKERNSASGPTWLQLGNMIVAALVVAALLYFGGGLYAVAHELQTGNVIQQRTQPSYPKEVP